MKRSFRVAIALGAVLSVAACSQSKFGTKGMGERCVRSTECQAGLACVGGMCSSDIGSLAEAGTVPVLMEAGVDGAAGVDAGDMGVDAGTMMPVDAGTMMGVDAGPPPPPVDAGPPPPPVDAGPPPPPDAGPPPPPDAGPGPVDAGFDAGVDAG